LKTAPSLTLPRSAGAGTLRARRRAARAATPWLMLAPAMAAAAILVLLPVLDTLWLSLHDVVLFRPRSRPFIGLANYARALNDPVFWESLGNSLVWVVGAVSLQFTLGFTAALLLNRSFAWRGVARALIVVPWALPSVIIGLIWTWMLDFNLGLGWRSRTPPWRASSWRWCGKAFRSLR